MSGAGSHFGGTYDDPHIRAMIDRELAERKEKAAREAEIVRLQEALRAARRAITEGRKGDAVRVLDDALSPTGVL